MQKLIPLFFILISTVIYSQTTPGVYAIKNTKVNTSYSDFGTAFYGKNKVVFAAPKQGITFTKDIRNNKKQSFLDLFIGEVTDDGEIINKQKMPGDINSKYHEGMVSFSKDLKSVYFSANWYLQKKKSEKKVKRKNMRNIQIFKARINKNGEWVDLEILPFNSPEFSSGHPTLNIDDTKLYFISDRPESIGKTDIFVVDIYEDGTYSEPKNLGPKINTIEREMFPFISDDNVLYFSSNGYPGYGELDVFACKIFDTTISDPISLGSPVNSEKDDFAYIIDDVIHKGYFSSNREGGEGDDDIYSFTVSPPIHFECQQIISGVVKDLNTQEILPGAILVLQDEHGNELETVIADKDDASFSFMRSCDTSYKIIGVLDGYLRKTIEIKTLNDLYLPPLKIFMSLPVDESAPVNSKNKTIDELITANSKNTLDDRPVANTDKKNIPVNESESTDKSVLTDDKRNMPVSESASVNSKNKTRDELITANSKNTPIIPINDNNMPADESDKSVKANNKNTLADKPVANNDQRNMPISKSELTGRKGILNINTIYFDFDKYYIRSDAEFELDKIAIIMKQYPNITIDVGSHADSRGKNAYNIKLSNNRAKSTIQYLVDKGIALNRISGKGYGEVQLAENCPNGVRCTEYQHQLNRRSEFVVANTSDDITIKSNNILNSNDFNKNESIINSGVFTNYNFSSNNKTVAYTVQIGAFRDNVQSKKYDKLTNLFNHRYKDGFNRYFAGKFKTPSEAKKYMRLLKKRGFEGAFVIGLKGNDRLY